MDKNKAKENIEKKNSIEDTDFNKKSKQLTTFNLCENVKEEEMFYNITEEKVRLLKKKKYIMNVILKTDVLEFSKEFLKEIINGMGIEVQIETKRNENFLKLTLHSNENPLLIGKNGKTLLSLQNILRQAILNKTGVAANILLDVENYKVKRERNIEFLAKKIAKEVEKTGVEVKMDSMNSYERRIVHNIISKNKNVTTLSEGEEPNRYVVVKPVK